jgi:hypothetical protein
MGNAIHMEISQKREKTACAASHWRVSALLLRRLNVIIDISKFSNIYTPIEILFELFMNSLHLCVHNF